jgi:hypothetical protein
MAVGRSEDQTVVPALHLKKDCACDLWVTRPTPGNSCKLYAGCEKHAKWQEDLRGASGWPDYVTMHAALNARLDSSKPTHLVIHE